MSAHDQITKLAHHLNNDFNRQEYLIERLLLTLLADGSMLLGGCSAPVVTGIFRDLARSVQADSCRIPFGREGSRSDPACFEVYRNAGSVGEFLFQPALVFSNLILLEGIHHASSTLQDALLAAIAEREVIVAGNSHPLPKFFMVMGTVDFPFEEDDHALSAEQRDQFLLHVALHESTHVGIDRIDYPQAAPAPFPQPDTTERLWQVHEFVSQRVLFEARADVRRVRMPESVEAYITALTSAIHHPADFSSELAHWLHRCANRCRGTHAIQRVSRAHAWFHGRDYVTLDDVAAVAVDCLRHRVILNLRARAEGKTPGDIINMLLDHPWLAGAWNAKSHEIHAQL